MVLIVKHGKMFLNYCYPSRLYGFYDNLGEIDTFILLVLFHLVGIFYYFFQYDSIAFFIHVLCFPCEHFF